MKKLIAIAVAAALIVPVAAVGASAGKKPKQTVEGTILAAPRHPDGCYSGVHRRLQAISGQQANGIVGYDFDVDKKTWKKPFALELTDGLGYVDLDITYYLIERETLEDFQGGDPPAPPTYAYETHEEGGEKGTVPEGATYAIVCIYQSEAGAGANASFGYTGG